MNLLFKREQTFGRFTRVNFTLWGRIELDEDEQAIVKRYRFYEAMLIAAIQPGLLKRAGSLAAFVFFLVFSLLATRMSLSSGLFISIIAGVGAGYWYFNEKRETIFVKDLLHGRHFTCDSVVELARKEAWLETVVAYLRQVMVSAKHWDGTQRHAIEPLPKDEARQVILRGL